MKTICGFILSMLIYSTSFGQNLELIRAFPDLNSELEGDFLVHPYDLELHRDQYIVLDASENCLKIYSKQGNFVRKIGRKGQGPGELLSPYNFALDKNRGMFFVEDRGNGRISIFDFDGNYVRAIRGFTSFRGMEYFNEKIYTTTYNSVQGTLFAVYSMDGKLLKNFGELFNKEANGFEYSKSLYRMISIQFYQGKLYAMYETMPYIEVYDVDGNLERRIEINVEEVQKKGDANIKGAKKGVVNGRMNISMWFMGADIKDNRFYLFATIGKTRNILEVDMEGNLLKRVKYPMDADGTFHLVKFMKKYEDTYIFADLSYPQIKIFREIEKKD